MTERTLPGPCYVYVYEFAGMVRYVGEGQNDRIQHHRWNVARYVNALANGVAPTKAHRFYSNYATALLAGSSPQYRKIAWGLSKAEAIATQDAEIARYPPGQLWNSVLSTHPIWSGDTVVAKLKAAWAKPGARDRRIAQIKASQNLPEVRVKKSAAMKVVREKKRAADALKGDLILTYTMGQAAKATGMSKPSLSRAIKAGTISATRNLNGSYTIDPAELHRVYPATSVNGSESFHVERSETPAEPPLNPKWEALAIEREATIADLRRRLDLESGERRAAQEKLTALLTDQRPRRWWRFGR